MSKRYAVVGAGRQGRATVRISQLIRYPLAVARPSDFQNEGALETVLGETEGTVSAVS